MTQKNHEISFRVYYEDTDAGGVVYHANYFNFCERARTEYLRAAGYTNQSLIEKYNIIFVVRHVEGDYIKPAFLEDMLTIKTTVAEIKNTSMIMRQTALKEGQVVFDSRITLVCVDKTELKPVRMPDEVRQIFINQ